MGQVLSTFLTIIGWGAALIFAYLLLKNAGGVATIEKPTFAGANTLAQTLQGR